MAQGRFPGPYVNTTDEATPFMQRTTMDRTSIGSNSEGIPKTIGRNDNKIDHVAAGLGGKSKKGD
jgi:hypothetical protein